MQRTQQTKNTNDTVDTKRTTQGKFAQTSMQRELSARIDDSPKMTAQRKKLQSLFGGAAQLQGTEDESLQKKTDEEMPQLKADTAQRQEEKDETQLKSDTSIQRLAKDEEIAQPQWAPSAQLKEAKPNNTGLPDNLKSGIENLSGMSMDNVKVHYNSSQPAQLNALAYAQGTDIHVAPGQEQHLPHEAWHVVQQAQGRVKPTMQMKEGVPVNDDRSLEHEADVMGAKAISASAIQAKMKSIEPDNSNNSILQRVPFPEALYVTSTQRAALSFNLRNGQEYNLDVNNNAVTRNAGNVVIGASTNYKGEYLPKTHNRPIYMLPSNDPMAGAEVLRDNNPAGHRTIGLDAVTDGTITPPQFNTLLQGFGWLRIGEWKEPTVEKDSWTIE